MTNEPQVTPEQLAQERSIRFALLADLGVLALFVPVGLLGGSLTIKAEAIRFVLGMSIEIFAYTVMWRLHRGKLHDLEYGGGKLEQIANLELVSACSPARLGSRARPWRSSVGMRR